MYGCTFEQIRHWNWPLANPLTINNPIERAGINFEVAFGLQRDIEGEYGSRKWVICPLGIVWWADRNPEPVAPGHLKLCASLK